MNELYPNLSPLAIGVINDLKTATSTYIKFKEL